MWFIRSPTSSFIKKKKKNSIYQTPGIVRGTGHKATEKIKFTVFMEILNSSTGVDKLQSTDQIWLTAYFYK